MGVLRQLGRKLRGPCCHLTTEEKTWVEQRLIWLRAQFGPGPIRRPPLDPSSPVLPRAWRCSEESGEDLFRRLCGFMQVNPARVRLCFYAPEEFRQYDSPVAGEWQSTGPAGLYYDQGEGDLGADGDGEGEADKAPAQDPNKLVIAADASALSDPASLAATYCHELAHVHLLADRRIKRDEADGEALTDLLTVYFGAGILTANSAIQFSQWQDGRMQGWSIRRQGYLSEALFGYALACAAWYVGDTQAAWQRHLRDNIAYYFEDSMHFLATTRDTAVPFDGA